MAKMLILIGLVLGIVTGLCAADNSPVVLVYLSQVGVVEVGKNSGPQVKEYLQVSSLAPGNPWCAAFVAWCYNKAGIKAIKSGYSPAWFNAKHTIYTRGTAGSIHPQPGDVFGIWFNNLGRIAHVGFVHQWGSKDIVTVEGNTNQAGSREGDGVYMKRRLTRQIYKVSRW